MNLPPTEEKLQDALRTVEGLLDRHRVLESLTVRRVGEAQHRKIDVRFVTATHRDLRAPLLGVERLHQPACLDHPCPFSGTECSKLNSKYSTLNSSVSI